MPGISRLWFECDGSGAWTALAVDPADFRAFEGYLDAIGVNQGLVGLVEEYFVLAGAPSTPAPAGELVGGLLEGDPLLPLVEGGAEIGDVLELYGLLGQPMAPIVTIALAEGAAQAAGQGQPLGAAIQGEVAEALNCLRSTAIKVVGAGGAGPGQASQPGLECAWPCVCTTHFGPVATTGPWTVEQTSYPSRTNCKYRRPGTAGWWTTGETFWLCLDCSSGSSTTPNPPTEVHLYGTEDLPAGATCPLTPGPNVPIVTVGG